MVQSTKTVREARAFGYFRDQTLPDLLEYFDSDFWSRLLLQYSESHAAVHYALVALSTQHEMASRSIGSVSYGEQNFALRQYTKAIGLVNRELQTKREGDVTEAALVCCLLFIYYESLQDNFKNALLHLENGLKACNWMYANTNLLVSSVIPQLYQIFSRLDTQATAFLDSRPPEYPAVSGTLTYDFIDTHGAREELDLLVKQTFDFLTNLQNYKLLNRAQAPSDIVFQHATLDTSLQKYGAALDALISKKELGLTRRDLCAVTLMKIHQKAVRIMILGFFSDFENPIDMLTPDFESIIQLAKSMLDVRLSTNKPTRRAGFSADMGLIPPLYFTAMQCRSTSIRQEAISLLRLYDTREGLWSSRIAAQIAEKMLPYQVNAVFEGMDDTGIPRLMETLGLGSHEGNYLPLD